MKKALIDAIGHHKEQWTRSKAEDLLTWAYNGLQVNGEDSPLLSLADHDEVYNYIDEIYPQ